jgi:hypothetical protein
MKTLRILRPNRLLLQITSAVANPNPIESNARITAVHAEIGRAIQKLIGSDAGPNFHNWATWGSLKAGETIAKRQLPQAIRDLTVGVAGVTTLACIAALAEGAPAYLMLGIVGLAMIAVAVGALIIRHAMRKSAAAILEGNRTVVNDIGRKSVAFLGCFEDGRPNARRLRAFFRGFRRGETVNGGQDLLRRAFRQYLAAAVATTHKVRIEAMYFGNCLAVLHEHYRLQPLIEASMPRLLRRYTTRFMMTFCIGERELAVHRDLPGCCNGDYPAVLQEIADPRLSKFLAKWDLCDGRLTGTGVTDWSNMQKRMNYIVNLFRSMHGESAVAA